MSLLNSLPRIDAATDDEVLYFLEHHRLFGRGLGYIDVHLLAATALSGDARLWTRDRRLHAMAAELDLARTGPS